jgi:hypothetical protein
MITDVMNNGTQGTQGFIQVQASRRIIALHPVCVGCIIIAWVKTPLYPSFYRIRRVGFTWKIRSVTVVHNPDFISTCPIYKI